MYVITADFFTQFPANFSSTHETSNLYLNRHQIYTYSTLESRINIEATFLIFLKKKMKNYQNSDLKIFKKGGYVTTLFQELHLFQTLE